MDASSGAPYVMKCRGRHAATSVYPEQAFAIIIPASTTPSGSATSAQSDINTNVLPEDTEEAVLEDLSRAIHVRTFSRRPVRLKKP